MMRNRLIRRLWKRLKMQDDEILAIKVYNPETETDEYLKVGFQDKTIFVDVEPNDEWLEREKRFRLIIHRDSSGQCKIPDVSDIDDERIADY